MADDRIDSIEVQVEANVSKAIAQINNLVGTIDKIRGSIQQIEYDNLSPDKSKLNEVKRELNEVSDAIKKVNKQKVDISIPKTTVDKHALMQGIEDATAAINRFTEIKRLAEQGSIKVSAEGMENITGNIEAATDALTRFKAIQESNKFNGGFDYVVTEAQGASRILDDLADVADMARGKIGIPMTPVIPLDSVQEAEREIARLEKRIAAIRFAMSEYIILQGGTSDDQAYKKMASTLENLEYRLSAARSRLDELKSGEADTSNEGERLTGTFNRLSSVAHTASSGFNKLRSTIKDIASHIKTLVGAFQRLKTHIGGSKKDTDDFSKKLKHGLRNIMRYGFGIRSLYFLFRRLRRAIKEGFTNLGQYSDDMRRSIDGLTASLTYVKNAFAAGFAPIVNIVAPYIEAFITMIGNALNAIGRFLAVLTGKGFAVQAVKWGKGLEDVGSGAGGAASGVKELRKQLSLLPFDELNQLAKDNGSNTGGGGGGGSTSNSDINNMFETIELDGNEWLQKWAEDIREAVAKQDWRGLGNTIAKGFNKAIERASKKLNDKSLREKIKKFAETAATTFNGFVEGLDWSEIGTAIGGGVNLIVQGLYSILTTTDWQALGTGLARSINGLVNTVDWPTLGKTWAAKTNVIWQALEGLTSEVKWADIGKAISGFINGFFSEKDFEAIATTISNAINGAFTIIGEAARDINWGQIADKISEGLNTFITSVDWAGNGGKLSQFAVRLFDTIYQIASTVDWEGLARGIGEFLDSIDWGTIIKDILGTIWEIGTGILKGLWQTTSGKIVLAILALKSPLGGAIKSLLTGVFGGAFGGGGGAGGMSFASRLGNFIAVAFKTGLAKVAPYLASYGGPIAGVAALVIAGVKTAMKAQADKPEEYTIFNEDWSKSQIETARKTGEYISDEAKSWAAHYDDWSGGLTQAVEMVADKQAEQWYNMASETGNASKGFERARNNLSDFFGVAKNSKPFVRYNRIMEKAHENASAFSNTVGKSLNTNLKDQSKWLTDADKAMGGYDGYIKDVKVSAERTARTLATDLASAFTGVKTVANDASNVLTTAFSLNAGSEKMKNFMNGLQAGAVNNKGGLITAMTDTGTGAVKGFTKGLQDENAVTKMTDAAAALNSKIIKFFGDIKTPGENKGKQFVEGITAGLDKPAVINPLKQTVQNVRDTAIVNPFNAKNTGITMGTDTGTGIKQGMTSQATKQTLQSGAREQREALTTTNQLRTWSTIGETLGKEIAKGIARTKMPKIEYDYSVVKSWNGAAGNKLTIPGQFVQAYAKGGLFNGATLSIIGEKGREAVLPLTNKRSMAMIADAILGSSPVNGNDQLAHDIVTGLANVLLSQPERPIQIDNYVTVKTENDEVLARAVDRGNRSLMYRGRVVNAGY